jgi:hypothetical protein
VKVHLPPVKLVPAKLPTIGRDRTHVKLLRDLKYSGTWLRPHKAAQPLYNEQKCIGVRCSKISPLGFPINLLSHGDSKRPASNIPACSQHPLLSVFPLMPTHLDPHPDLSPQA